MKFIRKALLPAVIAAGFLGFLGAVGPSVTTVSAAPGDICKITGPLFIEEGSTHDYTAIVESGFVNADEVDVDLNDFDGGDSDISSLDGDGDGDTSPIPLTDFLNDADLFNAGNVCGTSNADLLAATIKKNKAEFLVFILEGIDQGEVCSGLLQLNVLACTEPAPNEIGGANDTNGVFNNDPYNENDIDCGLVPALHDQCSINTTIINAVVDALAVAKANGTNSCTALGNIAEDAALLAGATAFVAWQFKDYVEDNCTGVGVNTPNQNDGIIMVDVTCDDPGVFDLTFAVQDGGAASIEVVCGSDAQTAEIFAVPTSVEINPSIANVAHSLVWVSIKGDNGEVAFPGTEVQWSTDRCSIESVTVDTEDEFEAAEGLFRTMTSLNPASAAAVESSVFATTGPDSASRQQEETNTFGVVGSASGGFVERTISAVVLHCDPIHAPGVTPGPAVITAFIERGDNDIDDNDLDNDISDNDDLVIKTTVTVVGPPAANGVTVTAAPSTLACGEKATITVDVKDAAGQPVSDHTWVEAVTNAGGVLAGTGAVAGQQGLVSPVSSTVAETFGGKATMYLLTSTAHVGKYEVVITTGGGGGVTGQLVNGGTTTNLLGGLFTTAPISVQVTVECTVAVAAAAPAATAPRTGQGITPPSTGDAGLASSNSSSMTLIAIAGAVALIATGFALKVVREEN